MSIGESSDSPPFRGFTEEDILTVVDPLLGVSLYLEDEDKSVLESVGINSETLKYRRRAFEINAEKKVEVDNMAGLNDLSKIKEDKLLKYWEGLGYYSRAKNLKKSARLIITKYSGRLPKDYDELKKLPGVGDYTASAISAIAFNKKIIPLDGNVERVLKRVFYLKSIKETSKENLHKKKYFFGESNRSSDYAQAIMEIGALVCKPLTPFCSQCPIVGNCKSFKKNW